MSSRRTPDIKLLQPRTPPDAGACMHGPSSLLRPCMLHLTRGLPHSTPCQAHPRAWQALARPESLTAYARFCAARALSRAHGCTPEWVRPARPRALPAAPRAWTPSFDTMSSSPSRLAGSRAPKAAHGVRPIYFLARALFPAHGCLPKLRPHAHPLEPG